MSHSWQMQDYKLTMDHINFENNLSHDSTVTELLRVLYKLW